MCSYHTQKLTCGGLTCGGGIHVQLPYTVLTYRECGGSIPVLLPYNLCGYHATPVWLPYSSWLATRFCVATIQLLVGYQILCGYHTTPVRLPYNFHVVHHNSCMVAAWELYGSHTGAVW